ncbi:uncharacterized protein PSFLO_06506 [Pseudozyma flocculosa]|uniref:Uncharacterized protein n=1 Tax=Pseudozyma flocculosa TaxID=84751 RepID=A0A5C3F990_9BASI|nr:uncharacterized protein PSFLO_06506 [Pseudozyma flocculosa]
MLKTPRLSSVAALKSVRQLHPALPCSDPTRRPPPRPSGHHALPARVQAAPRKAQPDTTARRRRLGLRCSPRPELHMSRACSVQIQSALSCAAQTISAPHRSACQSKPGLATAPSRAEPLHRAPSKPATSSRPCLLPGLSKRSELS